MVMSAAFDHDRGLCLFYFVSEIGRTARMEGKADEENINKTGRADFMQYFFLNTYVGGIFLEHNLQKLA